MYEIVVELSWKIHINYVLKNFFFTKGYYHEFNKKVLDHSKEINSSILIQLTIAYHKIINMFYFRHFLKYFRYLETETSLNNLGNLGHFKKAGVSIKQFDYRKFVVTAH